MVINDGKISSSHGRHLSGLDPLNLSIFSNALFVLTFVLLSSSISFLILLSEVHVVHVLLLFFS